MKLLLMSSTFTNDKLKNTFLNLLSKPPKENKVLIIHQKSYVKQTYPEYKELADTVLSRDIKILTELGILSENIFTFDIASEGKSDIKGNDILLLQGGNTFYYIDQMRKKGYWDIIRGFIENDGVYIGISAGSMIMSPSVDENLTWNENFVGLEDTSAFGYIDFYLLVHWDSLFKGRHTFSIKYSWKSGKKVIPLTDRQAVLVTDDGFKIISPD